MNKIALRLIVFMLRMSIFAGFVVATSVIQGRTTGHYPTFSEWTGELGILLSIRELISICLPSTTGRGRHAATRRRDLS